MSAPKLTDEKALVAIKGFEITPVKFKNSGGVVVACSVTPSLPLGFKLVVEGQACVLRGVSLRVAPRALYTITAENADGISKAMIEISVNEAPIKAQREAIIIVHDQRHDLDTPRSQVENAMSDAAMIGSTIKPHEKFANQPMGDDKRLTNQAANNPDAENRAQNTPELTPSPSAQLQQQAVLRASPAMTPTPTR